MRRSLIQLKNSSRTFITSRSIKPFPKYVLTTTRAFSTAMDLDDPLHPIQPSPNTSPVSVFRSWLLEAQRQPNGTRNAHIITLSTVDAASDPPRPQSRIVSCSDIDESGRLQFCTILSSPKAEQISRNAYVSVIFNWNTIQKSVRIDGIASPADEHVSNDAWRQRNRQYKLWALSTHQKDELESISELEERMSETEKNYEMVERIERPEHWGAYWIEPYLIEFWKGNNNGIHERYQYYKGSAQDTVWKLRLIEP